MNKIHCRAPFIGIALTPNGKYCCCCCNEAYTNNIDKHRLDMYYNNVNELCKICSVRQEFNSKTYDDIYIHNIKNFNTNTGVINDFKIGWLHLVYTYFCNADCVMCGLKKNDNQSLDLSFVPTQKIPKISLQGGEIFLFENEILKVLNLINPEFLNIVTNGTVVSHKIYEKISKFQNSCVNFSIDGVGIVNESIRKNCKYEKIIHNIKLINKKYSNLTIVINYTVTIFNIYNIIDDLIQLKKDLQDIKFILCLNLCYQPKYFSVCCLDDFNKEEIKKLIDIKTMVKNKLLENIQRRSFVMNLYKNPYIFNELIDLINYTPENNVNYKLLKKEIENRMPLKNILHKNIEKFISVCN